MLPLLWTGVLLSVSFTAIDSAELNCSGTSPLNYIFRPERLLLKEGTRARVQLTMTAILNSSSDVTVTSLDDRIIDVVNKVTCTFTGVTSDCSELDGAAIVYGHVNMTYVSTEIRALRLGKDYLVYRINSHPNRSVAPESEGDGTESLDGVPDRCVTESLRYPVVVVRNTGIQDRIYHIVIQTLLGLLNFAFGCKLDMVIIWSYLKKPLAPSIGFCSQFLFMPLLGIAIAQILKMDPCFGMGLVSLACAPGGGASNSWTILLGGDVNLSLTMTFLSLVLALGMMPLWMYIMSHVYIQSSVIRIPYLQIITTLAIFVGPCFLGIAVRKLRAKWAKRVSLMIKPVSVVFLLWILTFGTYVNLYMFELMGDEPVIILAGMLLPWCGFGVGFALAAVTRQGCEKTIAIAIETGIQNFGVPIVLLQRSFPQPEGDLGAAVVNAAGIFTPVPLFISLVVLTARRRCRRNDKAELVGHREPPEISNVLIASSAPGTKEKTLLEKEVRSEDGTALENYVSYRISQSEV